MSKPFLQFIVHWDGYLNSVDYYCFTGTTCHPNILRNCKALAALADISALPALVEQCSLLPIHPTSTFWTLAAGLYWGFTLWRFQLHSQKLSWHVCYTTPDRAPYFCQTSPKVQLPRCLEKSLRLLGHSLFPIIYPDKTFTYNNNKKKFESRPSGGLYLFRKITIPHIVKFAYVSCMRKCPVLQ